MDSITAITASWQKESLNATYRLHAISVRPSISGYIPTTGMAVFEDEKSQNDILNILTQYVTTK